MFLIIVVVSFFLALRSMADFKESPGESSVDYGLFLIRNPHNLTSEVLSYLHRLAIEKGLILSLEVLFRDTRQAWVIDGPYEIILPLKNNLDLLEIEDYSLRLDSKQTTANNYAAWEVGSKKSETLSQIPFDEYLPELPNSAEFWWQVLIRPIHSQKSNQFISSLLEWLRLRSLQEMIFPASLDQLEQNGDQKFQTVIRAVVQSQDSKSIQNLKQELVKVGNKQGLAMLPQAYTNSDIVSLYQTRTFPAGKFSPFANREPQLILTSQEVLEVVGRS